MPKITQSETSRAGCRKEIFWLPPCSSKSYESETQRKVERYKN